MLLELRGDLYDRYWNNTRGLNAREGQARREVILKELEEVLRRIDQILENT